MARVILLKPESEGESHDTALEKWILWQEDQALGQANAAKSVWEKKRVSRRVKGEI